MRTLLQHCSCSRTLLQHCSCKKLEKVEHCKEQSQEVVQDGYRRVWQLAVVIIGPLLEAIFRAIHLGLLLGTARPQAVLCELDPFVQDDEHCEERCGTRELGPVFQ